MSELRADTITGSDGSSPVTLTKQHAAKAWVYSVVSGGTPALTDSFNVSTITDVGVGDYKFNLVSAMNNATFATSITPQYSTASGSNAFFHQEDGSDKATTSFGLDHFQNGTKADPTRESGIIFGDLA
jgi:hypothetical protein